MELVKIHVSVKCFVLNPSGWLLILHRSPKEEIRPGETDLPGGSAGPGEPPKIAVVREVKEESGIILACEALRFVTTLSGWSQRFGDFGVRHFYAAAVDGQVAERVVTSEEHSGYEWAPLDQANERLTHEAQAEALKRFCQLDLLAAMLPDLQPSA